MQDLTQNADITLWIRLSRPASKQVVALGTRPEISPFRSPKVFIQLSHFEDLAPGEPDANALDQYVKRTLRCRHYLRYVDDTVLLSESREELVAWRAAIAAFLDQRLQLCLRVQPKEIVAVCPAGWPSWAGSRGGATGCRGGARRAGRRAACTRPSGACCGPCSRGLGCGWRSRTGVRAPPRSGSAGTTRPCNRCWSPIRATCAMGAVLGRGGAC
ncbi:MAG TPA: hypothetical protein EYQ54_08255 [Myxococcales bacterium]|nr:hypothetical protein [Myxococcales bacterium]